MKKELVSIITPTFNDQEYIAETIESVLSQTYPNWELIIVDDCSSDQTPKIIKSFSDPRIRFFKNEVNSGAAHSRNVAISHASGDLIAFLDGDDTWSPEKLSRQIDFMNEKGLAFTCTYYTEFHEEDGSSYLVTAPKVITKKMEWRCCYNGCLTTMYRRSKFENGVSVDPSIKKRNDYAIWLQLVQTQTLYTLEEDLATYRVRKNSISHVSIKKLLASHVRLFRIQEHKSFLSALFLALRNAFFIILKKRRFKKAK